MPNYYPIMLDVRGRLAIVVGGNSVAAEKAASLSASGANVVVLNADFCNELISMEQEQKVTLWRKAYEPGDLAKAFVVVAVTTYDPQLTDAIFQEIQEHRQLLNIVDVPARCNFIVPSILRRGQLTIAVSTEGASPSLAKRIRQQLEKVFPPAYGPYLRIASLVRTHIRQRGLSYQQCDNFFGDFYKSGILKHLIRGEKEEALAETHTLLKHYEIAEPDVDILAAELRKAV